MRVLLIVLLLAAPAAADSYAADEAYDNDWHAMHPELAAGIAQRDGQLAGNAIHGRQAEVSVAFRGKRRATELAYGFGILPAGVAHAVTLRHRYGLAVIGGYAQSLRRGEAWIEGGLGAEVFDWSDAGHLTRPALSLGFGADVDFGTYTDSEHPHRWLGARFAVRMTAAPAPADAPLVCAGPCGAPSSHLVDLGIVVSLSVLVGP